MDSYGGTSLHIDGGNVTFIGDTDSSISYENVTDWRRLMADALPNAESMHRFLQVEGRGRTVLTVLYLCVLGLCFVVPVFYYFRMHCDERQARRLRDLEMAGITQAVEQSQTLHREESRAARRKYREERKARIVQLFAPVRMELKEENFPHLRGDGKGSQNENKNSVEKSRTANSNTDSSEHASDVEEGGVSNVSTSLDETLKSVDQDQLSVEVPAPGFQFSSSALLVGQMKHRLVPNVCSICLCNYEVGDQIVWSSNEGCEHVFHEQCILQWIMKQREGPLCPCCRRDFVLDPYDIEDEEVDPTAACTSIPPETLGDASEEEDGGRQEETAMVGRQSTPAEDAAPMNMEEGLSSNSSRSSRRTGED